MQIPEQLNSFLEIYLYGNYVREYLISFFIFLVSLFALYVFKKFIISRIRKLSERTSTNIDDIFIQSLSEIHKIFYIFVGIYFASSYLQVKPELYKVIQISTIIVAGYELIKFFKKILVHLARNAVAKSKTESDTNKSVESVVVFVVNVAVWSAGIMFLLQNLGVNVTALLGGLGIGGIAIAFALQSILGDLFSFFSIYFDKPFKVGDFLILGDDMGTVEKIGIRSTRLRAIQGEELVVPNSELTGTRINNYQKLNKRRVVSTLGVIYETPKEKLKKIPSFIKEVVTEMEKAELDRAHFSDYGDFSLNFEYVYYVLSNDYNTYMDVKQNINYAIFERFEKEGIVFAYPTQQIYTKSI